MDINFKKVTYSVFGSLILIFSVWFYTHHYNLLFDSKLNITCKAFNSITHEPISHAEIVVTRIEKPWYSMWSTQEIISGNTNEIGEFNFQISESKRYRVTMLKEDKKRFIGDNQTFIGGTEFEGNEVADGDIIIIPCDKKNTKHNIGS